MDDDEAGTGGGEAGAELEPRAPVEGDVAELCSQLNGLGARYLIVGGFAVIHAGYPRTTMALDLIIATDPENEAKVFEALRSLPDRAVDELDPGDVAEFTVVRVADEIVVDLMRSASGIDYDEAAKDVVVRERGPGRGGAVRLAPLALADEEVDPPREGRCRPRLPAQVVRGAR